MNDPERKLSSPVATTQEVGAPGNCQGVRKALYLLNAKQNEYFIAARYFGYNMFKEV